MDFSSLPIEYQNILGWVEQQHAIQITPLQELRGGRTGARLYLVSAGNAKNGQVEHYVLKLDQIRKPERADEIHRHQLALEQAPADFGVRHTARLALTAEHDGTAALFYTIAGQSLQNYRALADYDQQSQLETIFRTATDTLLTKWNARPAFEQGMPQSLLKSWLGYRLTAEGNIVSFFENHLGLRPGLGGLLIDGQTFPNPLAFGFQGDRWGQARLLDAIYGFQHGDLNIGNILVRFARGADELDGFYLIDFALYKPGMPLLYDLRYLEISYLLRELERVPLEKWIALVSRYGTADMPDPKSVPAELAGPCGVINAGRLAFQDWIRTIHPSLTDDLWGQSWLASVAAGLNYCNKAALPAKERLAGLIYACAHLKRYCVQFGIPIPNDVGLLYDSNQPDRSILVQRPAPATGTSTTHLPVQPTPFIGRQPEIAEVKRFLLRDEVRLLTLTGPGGTGKTRLALRVAEEIQPHFEQGITFVPLADIRDPDLLVTKIAQGLGFREGGSLPLLEVIKSYLADRRMLLVLDNFEQIVAAAPRLVELLSAAPTIKVMVTSRNLLNVSGEREFVVSPLSLPDPTQGDSPDDLVRSEAVQLFVARAEAANPRFVLDDENAQAVLEICRRLDGLPLAIELAAARIRLLPPQAMLSRLNDRLALLTSGARDLPDRQRTLRSTIDWSYELLEVGQKTLFARLGVFVGGFTLEAAEAICNPDGDIDVLAGVEALMTNSLVRKEESTASQVRFAMLETIRDYSLERLQASGEMDGMRQGHAAYYSGIMQRLGKEEVVFSAEIGRWLDWIDEEHENLRAVQAWSQSAPDRFMPGVLCITGMFWYWYRRGHLTEGRQWIEWALSTPAGRQLSYLQGLMLSASAALAMHQSDFDTAHTLTEEGLTVASRLEETRPIGILLTEKGMILSNRGQDAAARAVLEQARDLFKESGFDWWLTDNLLTLSTAVLGLGDVQEALEIVRQAEQVSKGIADDWLTAYVLNCYGEVARVQGEYASAGEYYQEGERLLRKQGDRGGELPRIIHSQGYVAQRQGDLEAAEGLFRESLSIFVKIGNRRGIAEGLAGIAGVWGERGEIRRAAVLLSAASHLMESSGAQWWPADRIEYGRNLAAIRSGSSEDEFAAAWEQGRALTLEAAIEYAAQN